jgi:hypothetical protein
VGSGKLGGMTSLTLANTLEEFLSESNSAVVMEDGAVIFDLSRAKYSLSGEGECLLHFWSDERNVVRRVLDADQRRDASRDGAENGAAAAVAVGDLPRMRSTDASAKRICRAAYVRVLERMLHKSFPDFTVAQLSASIDLEQSFGPIYARGLLCRGQSAFAVLGVNRRELQGSVDAALTSGILWLDVCRTAHAGRMVVEGLKLFIPAGCSALVRERMAHLNRTAAKWELFEVDERAEELKQIEIGDRGNVSTRQVHCSDDLDIQARFVGPIALVHGTMPEAEIAVLSPVEIAFRCHGLEFARAKLTAAPGEFNSVPELVLGSGSAQRVLDDSNFHQFETLVRSIGEVRHADGPCECR